MVIFHSYVSHYQRVSNTSKRKNHHLHPIGIDLRMIPWTPHLSLGFLPALRVAKLAQLTVDFGSEPCFVSYIPTG
jgi:hypothetical protein